MIIKDNKYKWLTIVGIGEQGFSTLTTHAQSEIAKADQLIGSERQLSLIPIDKTPNAKRVNWETPMMPHIKNLIETKPNNTVIIASGDPMCWGIGQHFSDHLIPTEIEVIPYISILSQVTNLMQWPTATTPSISLCSQPLETLAQYLQPNQKIILLSANDKTPAQVGNFLSNKGYGNSKITILENIGNSTQSIKSALAETIEKIGPFSTLNSLAITIQASDNTTSFTCHPGLPDIAYDHDGQMTKQNMRAITLAHLRPNAGELLWDIGSGSGSIGIEWLRAGSLFNGPPTKAIGFEKNKTRLNRAQQNASNLGVPHLELIEGNVLDNIDTAPSPDAIFIGGGITSPDLLEKALKALNKNGRLVANTVTIEGTSKLIDAYKTYGGSLSQISSSTADPVGSFNGMRPQMAITQWVYIKTKS